LEPGRFDQILRQFATGSRRQTLKTLAGGALGVFGVHLGVRQVAAQLNCFDEAVQNRACGGCKDTRCFLDPRTSQCVCCPKEQFCEGETFEADQCCYKDEVCAPGKASASNSFSNCCRKCGGKCCDFDEKCRNGKCRPINTARGIRRRT
jgi:hypothetical protein